MKITVSIRFYEELNDYLPLGKQKREFKATVDESSSVGQVIELFGIPYADVDLILVNGKPVSFGFRLKDNDRISVYPVFETFDISNVSKLREKPLREPKFIISAHFDNLFRYLIMLGIDVKHEPGADNKELVECAHDENRIILTGDKNLLKSKRVARGYWIRNTEPVKQLKEVLEYFNLYSHLFDG